MASNIDYCIYGDTDSVVGDTEIVVNNKKMKISDYFESVPVDKMVYRDDFNNNYVKEVDNDVALSLNTDTEKAENKKVKYVMKHKVKKQM